MKRQTLLKGALCLLMALVCNVAWADFTQQWTNSPVGPWTTTASTENPDGIATPLASASKDGTTVHKAMVDVCAPANATVTVKFVYSGGGHKLNIVGVDLVGADGAVKASDYHYGTTGGSHVNNTFTMANVEAGDYTLRYFVCDNSKDNDRLSSTRGTITVTGLDLNRLKYNVGDGKYNDRSGSSWRNGWTSTNAAKPSFTIAVGANNMNAGVTEYIGMRPGQSGCTYTLTLGEPFIRYSFEAKSDNASPAHVITIDGKATTISSTEWTTITVDVYGTTTQFQLTGSNGQDLYIRNIKFVQDVPVASKDEFMNGGIYTFVTERGWMGAKADNDNVISTAKSAHGLTGSATNAMFQWTVYKSNNGNYYLYNVGKQQFMGVQSTNNESIPFSAQPAGKKLTFKQSSSSEFPIMFSTDNAGVVNHSTSYGDGLITWTGGWDTLNDGGSNHKVTLVGKLSDADLQAIADKVEAYDKRLYVKAEVEGSWANNPNTHFGRVRATSSTGSITTKLNIDMDVVAIDYDGLNENTIDFTRAYRGFEFQGYSLGDVDLGKSFTLTDEHKALITAENPLVAKFIATDDVTLWYDDDPFSYRIPAIGKTSTDRLIAVSDYRYSLDDIGRYNYGTATPGIDLVIRMSDDNGKTWGETKTIAKCSGVRGANDCAYGDAAIAVVGQKVLVMGAAGDVMFGSGSATAHNRTVRILSEDNGANWTQPKDISETLFIGEDATIKNGYTAFFGSGKLAVDENYNNTDNARIYGAMLIKKEGYGNAIYVIYTDDFGVTWSILGGSQTPVTTNDEPKVEILPNGQILLSVRRGGGRQFNVFTYSDKATNAGTWNSNVNGCGNGGSNTCNGEIYVVDAKKANGDAVKLLLQSQPKGGGGLYDRRDVTIWYKEITDVAYTSSEIAGNWIEGMQVSNQLSAYSTMVLQNDGKIAFFFEEAPCYGDDYAKGYSMVYTPLTIESITKGNYFSPNADLSTERTINVVLTDAQGNDYRCQVQSGLTGIVAALTTQYPYITLGDNANLSMEDGVYTYTNTVTLPFKVSNEEITVWHNIYWPSYGNDASQRYPVYLSATATDDEFVPKVTESNAYGNSSYNTADKADNISWAVYSVNGGFTFKFKNKLTGKFIQATGVATDNNKNVKYVDEASATAFVLDNVKQGDKCYGDYALKAEINSTVGYLCSTSATGYQFATHYNGKGHPGAWAKFVEAPDFAALIAEVNATLDMIGAGLGQYAVSEANVAAAAAAKEAMKNSATVKLNTLNSYKTLLNSATLNMPKAGQFFRIRGISGNYIDASSIHGNVTATTGQMSMKSAESCNYNGTIFYLDEENHLLNYATGRYIKETREIGVVGDDAKGVWTFAESPRKGGKYALSCTTTNNNGANLHDNEGNRADRCSGNCGNRHDFTLEEVTELPVSVTTAGYATFYAPVAVKVEGVTANTVTVNGEWAILNEIEGGVIPANTGVILMGNADTYDFAITTTDKTIESALSGSVEAKYVNEDAYVLANGSEGVGLYMATLNQQNNSAFLNNAFKAYLPASAVLAGVRFLSFNFGDDVETSIESVEGENGKAEIYDLAGRRVQNAQKGVFIVNGKVVIK